MTFIRANTLPCSSFPHLDCLILSTRGDIGTIWRPCRGIDWAGMIAVVHDVTPCESIPGLYGSIKASRGNTLTIRRPCNAKYPILLPVSIHQVSAKCGPYLHRAIPKVPAGCDV